MSANSIHPLMVPREIKFRAWDTFNKRMIEPAYFHPATERDRLEGDERFNAPFIYYEDWRDYEDGISRSCYIMQFTGLTDKNGKEIYEGDVVRCGYGTGVVEEMLGGWWVRWIDDKEAQMELLGLNSKFRRQREDDERFEVIGNIFQNPEYINQNQIVK